EAEGGVRRAERNDERAQTHERDGQGERRASAVPVGISPEPPAADRPGEKADGEDGRRVEELRGVIALREERGRKIDGERGVRIPVVPPDEVADRPAEERPERTLF